MITSILFHGGFYLFLMLMEWIQFCLMMDLWQHWQKRKNRKARGE